MEQTIKPHKEIMVEADNMTSTHGVKQKGGKKYLEVKHRITILRRNYALALGIDTTLLEANDKYVRVITKITDPEGRILASGMAEEMRDQGPVNKTSALENCESSSIGRAIAALGLHGGEYPSYDEMDAVERKTEIQKQPAPVPEAPMAEDKIPDPFDGPPVSNSNAGEFHPSANWDAWVAIEKSKIDEFSSPGDTTSWFQQNKEYLIQLKKYNVTMHQDIEKAWGIKQERMNK